MPHPPSSFDDPLNNAPSNGVDPFRAANDQLAAAAAAKHDNPAVNLIRQKIASLYDDEPAARQEIIEARTAPKLSKHQQFILNLSTSGKSLAEIQTDWHQYY